MTTATPSQTDAPVERLFAPTIGALEPASIDSTRLTGPSSAIGEERP
jgi:hypothetical protein